MPIDTLMEKLVREARWRRDHCILRVLPEQKPSYKPMDDLVSPAVADLLKNRNIFSLYSHQAEALEILAQNQDILLSTPTASGKSLVYQIPALEILKDPDATALFLFPFKALAQDQARTLRELADGLLLPTGRPAVELYDGDTPQNIRKKIKKKPPGILMTNPDMLHYGILPYHASWMKFLERLRLLVVDEIHVYRGVFGSHVLQIFRRLMRILEHYGSNPRIIACSATIGNPEELSRNLLGRSLRIIHRSGAPFPEKGFLSHLPDMAKTSTAAVKMFESCLKHGLKTIVFTKSRRMTELIYRYMKHRTPSLASRISAYRAGFLPEDRRAIERRLFSGELAGVVSTSALELGIDVGGLDCCILVGFPGSVSSLWQRAGRVGRAGLPSLVIFIAGGDALDHFWFEHEAQLHESPVEKAVVYENNDEITDLHLPCAASELILEPGRNYPMTDHIQNRIKALAERHVLLESADGDRFISRSEKPHRNVSIRSAGETYQIRHIDHGVLGNIDGVRVFKECHEGAIYLHGGGVYRVIELDMENFVVVVEDGPEDIYTQAISEKETEILSIIGTRDIPGGTISHGRLRVHESVTGYMVKRIFTDEVIQILPLELPELTFETRGIWIGFNDELIQSVREKNLHPMGGLHAIEHAVIGLFPLVSICDRNDLAGISTTAHPQTGGATVFIYDAFPGGLGLAESALPDMDHLLETTRKLIENCRCAAGCPYCIHSPKCGSGNVPLDKNASIHLLEGLYIETRERSRTVNITPLKFPEEKKKSDFVIQPPHPDDCPPGTTIVFDIETQLSADEVGGWKYSDRMRVAAAVVYDESLDRFDVYGEPHVDQLIRRLEQAGKVVGFNSEHFDFKVLSGYLNGTFPRANSLDLLKDIRQKLGHRLSLNQLAAATLGAQKTADGLQSLKWWKEGRLDLIVEYCKKDVEITYKLYKFGRENGYVLYPHRNGMNVRVYVDWK